MHASPTFARINIASCKKTHTDIFTALCGRDLSCDDATREFSKRLSSTESLTWVPRRRATAPLRRRSCPRGSARGPPKVARPRSRRSNAAAPALSAALRAADAEAVTSALGGGAASRVRWAAAPRMPMRTARNPSRAKVMARPRPTRPPRSGPARPWSRSRRAY